MITLKISTTPSKFANEIRDLAYDGREFWPTLGFGRLVSERSANHDYLLWFEESGKPADNDPTVPWVRFSYLVASENQIFVACDSSRTEAANTVLGMILLGLAKTYKQEVTPQLKELFPGWEPKKSSFAHEDIPAFALRFLQGQE